MQYLKYYLTGLATEPMAAKGVGTPPGILTFWTGLWTDWVRRAAAAEEAEIEAGGGAEVMSPLNQKN